MAATFSRTLRAVEADGARRWTLQLSAAMILLGAWGAWFLLDRIAVYEVADSTRLESQIAAHPLAAPITGRVVRTHLELGRSVRAGEVLVELDAEAERLTLAEARARLAGLRSQIASLGLEIEAEKTGLDAHRQAMTVALDESQARVTEAEVHARFAAHQIEARRTLRKGGVVSEEDFRQRQAKVDAAKATVEARRLATTRLEQQYRVERIDRRAQIAKLERKLAELQGEAGAEEAAIRRLEHAIELFRVRTPIAGRVGQVDGLRIGSVVQPAQVLGIIVPAGKPRAVAYFPVSVVGRIRPNQAARLRFDGFSWTRYGTLPAVVEAVGNEPLNGRVRVELAIETESGSAIPLEHGLSALAEVEVERVSPVQLVLRVVGKWLSNKPSTPPVVLARHGAFEL
jgi:multidrug resistance efflux pump